MADQLSQLLDALAKHPELEYRVRERLCTRKYFTPWMEDVPHAYIMADEAGRLLAWVGSEGDGTSWRGAILPSEREFECFSASRARRLVCERLHADGWRPVPPHLWEGALPSMGVGPWCPDAPSTFARRYTSGRLAAVVRYESHVSYEVFDGDQHNASSLMCTSGCSVTYARLHADANIFRGKKLGRIVWGDG